MNRLIRLPEVLTRTGLSKSMVYLLIERGDFPRQVQVADRAVAWVEAELDAWIEARISRRSRNPGQAVFSEVG